VLSRWRTRLERAEDGGGDEGAGGAEGDERILRFQVTAERVGRMQKGMGEARRDGLVGVARSFFPGAAEERMLLPSVERLAVDFESAADCGIGVAREEAIDGVALASGEGGGGWAAGFSKCIGVFRGGISGVAGGVWVDAVSGMWDMARLPWC
jgi:hypothetical protein